MNEPKSGHKEKDTTWNFRLFVGWDAREQNRN